MNIRKNIKLLFSALLLSYTIITGCGGNTTGPDKTNPGTPDNTPPGKRVFTWSVDSIAYDSSVVGPVEVTSMYGSSENDIWAAGFTTDVRNCLLHYNGKCWERAVYGTPVTTGGTGSRQVGYLWGTSQSDVWAIGGRIFSATNKTAPFAMHFNGVSWTEWTKDEAEMPDGGYDIAGVSSNEFYVACHGYISHYKDGRWKRYYLDRDLLINRIAYYNGALYLIAYGYDFAPIILYRFKENKFEKLDETIERGKFELSIFINNDIIYTSWYSINANNILKDGKINPGLWEKQIVLPYMAYATRGFRKEAKNCFFIGYPSIIYHYNGTDWANIDIIINGKKVEDACFTSMWTDGKTIVLVDSDHSKIYRGK